MSSIAARLDRMPFSRFHLRLLVMGGFGYLFDAMDVAVVAFVLPILKVQWDLDATQMGVVAASAAVGGCVGAPLAGWLGDAVGRRPIMMWALPVYCIATVACAAATHWTEFLFWRTTAGIGTGAESAIVAPFLTEFAAPSYRGRYVGALASFFSLGFLGAAAIGYLVVPNSADGWRWALAISGSPIIMLPWWRRSLPESPRWLESKGRVEEADLIVSEMELLRPAVYPTLDEMAKNAELGPKDSGAGSRGRVERLLTGSRWKITVMALVAWFSIGYSYYAFFTWMPSLLVSRGMNIAGSYTYAIFIYAAQLPGYVSAAWLNDIIGYRAVIVIYMFCGSVAALSLAMASSNRAILVGASLLSFFMNGTYGGIYAYTPELFPTALRATGSGIASSMSRVGAVLSPMVVGGLLPAYGFSGVFAMSTCVLLGGALVVLVVRVPSHATLKHR